MKSTVNLYDVMSHMNIIISNSLHKESPKASHFITNACYNIKFDIFKIHNFVFILFHLS